MARLWDHVLVDEYQDTNTLQAEILRRLRPAGGGVTVVGDDAQAIYGVPGGRRPQHTVARSLPGHGGGPARAELPLGAAHPGRGQRGDGPGRRAASPEALWSARPGRRPARPAHLPGRKPTARRTTPPADS